MENEKQRLIRCINKFLSFFNLSLKDKDNCDLVNELFFYNKILVFNKDRTNVVGNVIKSDNVLISCNNGIFKLNAIISLNKTNKISFCLKKENNSLDGYVIFNSNGNILNGLYEISNENELINRDNLSSYENYVNFHDAKTKESVNFKAKEAEDKSKVYFNHYQSILGLSAFYDSDYLYYEIRKVVEKTKFQDCDTIVDNKQFAVGYPYTSINLNVALNEIIKIFQEYDLAAFDFISSVKDKINYFSDSLYEKTFSNILLDLNRKNKECIFKIEDSNKKRYVKEIKNHHN